jgi:hypothetical protein
MFTYDLNKLIGKTRINKNKRAIVCFFTSVFSIPNCEF